MFKDREDAGQKLAKRLEHYRETDAIVLAIPRGGVEIGYIAAKHIDTDFSILVTRKLPFPHNPESGFGAVAEDGSVYTNPYASGYIKDQTCRRILEQQKEEIERRIRVLRNGEPMPEISGRTVILVDDGIAMGSTMRASISYCKNHDAGKIVVAAPVSGERTKEEIRELVDDIIILETPCNFRAVAQVYFNWYDVPDREAAEFYNRWKKEKIAQRQFK